MQESELIFSALGKINWRSIYSDGNVILKVT